MTKKTRTDSRVKRHARVRKNVEGTLDRPRMSVFRSLGEIYAQVIDDKAGHTLASASTVDHELREKMTGLKKTEQAQLVGELVGRRALEKGVKQIVFDRGGFRYIGRVKALAEGARKAGLDF